MKIYLLIIFNALIFEINAQYKLPFPKGQQVKCTQGNNGSVSHFGKAQYAYDLRYDPQQSGKLLACRSGLVSQVQESFSSSSCYTGSCSNTCKNSANRVVILHSDGTKLAYIHIPQNGSLVNVGDNIIQGQEIAYIGESGCTSGVHVHLQLMNSTGNSSDWYNQSIPFIFDEISTNSGYLIGGQTYTSQNELLFKPLNQSLPIYGGSTSSPKKLDLYVSGTDFPVGFNTSFIQNFKINNVAQQNASFSNVTTKTIKGKTWYHFDVDLNVTDLASIPNNNTYVPLTFDYVNGANKKYVKSDELYFVNVYSSSTFTDIKTNGDWSDKFIRDGAYLGLFRGYNQSTFGVSDNLTKAQAAKMIVTAAIKLGLFNIDESDGLNGTFSDVPSSSQYFPYIQTLRNLGYIDAGSSYNPNNTITIGQISKIFVNAFALNNETEINDQIFYNQYKGKIVVSYPTNPTLESAMKKLTRLYHIVPFGNSSVPIVDPLFGMYNFSQSSTNATSTITVNGTDIIKRNQVAKMITNICKYKAKKLGLTIRSSDNIADYAVLGEKYENTDIPQGNPLNISIPLFYSCNFGDSILIQYPSNTHNSSPLSFFWSMEKNGADLRSNSSTNHSIYFKAPATNTGIPSFKIYTYVANNKGYAQENIITINVGSTSGGGSTNLAPTIQVSNLNVYNITSNSAKYSLTRGNGHQIRVLITNDLSEPNTPPSFQSYCRSKYYGNCAAPNTIIPHTQLILDDPGLDFEVLNLSPSTTYRIFAYEQNDALTPLGSNVPIATFTTLPANQTNPSANFTWNEALTFQTGQSFAFTNTSQNANQYTWILSPNDTLSVTTSSNPINMTFPTSGQYTLTLIAKNTTTGQTSTRSHNFYVYNANDLKVDLEPVNLSFPSPFTGGQNLQIVCSVANNSNASSAVSSNIAYALSTDQVWDVNDYLLSSQTYYVQPAQSVPVTHNTTGIPAAYNGDFYILAKTDFTTFTAPNGYVDESNETNNVVSKPIKLIAALPDFVTHTISAPTTIQPNVAFTVTGTFQNLGSGNSFNDNEVTSKFFISTDNQLSYGDYKISGNFTGISSVKWGNSAVLNGTSTTTKIGSNIPDGNYYLICAIDNCIEMQNGGSCSDNNFEINEINNWKAVPITIQSLNQPTVNASNFSITNITKNSMRVNWTRGNGQGCIVLARAYSYEPFRAVDGYEYTPNSNFSSAPSVNWFFNYEGGTVATGNHSNIKCVYKGTGNYVDVSGLDSNESYSFTVLEYNGSSTSTDYLQNTDLKCISAHTLYSDNSPFIRLLGTVNSSSLSGVSTDAIKFFDENNGLIFKWGNGIGKTNDGGKTWLFKFNATIEKNGTWWQRSSDWTNNGKGWIVNENGKLLKTSDFGNTWEEKLFNRKLIDIKFVNENDGYIGAAWNSNSNVYDGAIYKSTDGGSTWSILSQFPRYIQSLFFLNNQEGWCASYSASTNATKVIYKTTNGGSSWSQFLITTNTDYTPVTDIYFINSSVGFLMLNSGYLYKTINGGVTWTKKNIFNLSSNANSYSKIKFLNSSVGYINLANFKLAKTLDGGSNWNIYTIQSTAQNGSIAEIDAVSDNTLYCGGYTGILKTNTGGVGTSISLANISGSYCTNNELDINYSILGTYPQDNVFTLEISDITGNFSNSTLLKEFNNPGVGSIKVSFPTQITAGTGYKIRLKASNPALISNEIGAITLIAPPVNNLTISTDKSLPICNSNSLRYTATAIKTGANPSFVWYKNADSVATGTQYFDNSPQENDAVYVKLKTDTQCQAIMTSTPILVEITNVDTPYIDGIDSILVSSIPDTNQWYWKGQMITSATGQFHNAIQSGYYRVETRNNGCKAWSDSFYIDLANIIRDTVSIKCSKPVVTPFPLTQGQNTTFSYTITNDGNVDYYGALKMYWRNSNLGFQLATTFQDLYVDSSYNFTHSSTPLLSNAGLWYLQIEDSLGNPILKCRDSFIVQPGSNIFSITLSSNPAAGGTTSGGGNYILNTECAASTTINNGYTFLNWSENGSIVSNDMSYTFNVDKNRNLVANFKSKGSNISNAFTENILIYPNPAKSILNIDLPTNEFTVLRIENLLGQVLLKRNLVNFKNQLDVSLIPKGVYIIELKNIRSEKSIQKLIIE